MGPADYMQPWLAFPGGRILSLDGRGVLIGEPSVVFHAEYGFA